MRLYRNGDRCPCCGSVLEGRCREWLQEFSLLVDELGLPPWPETEDNDGKEEDA